MPRVYLWNDNYYCDGDIVSVLTSEPPYSKWIDAGHEPGEADTDEQLDEIAAMFNVNRKRASSVRLKNFPTKLDQPPSDPAAFCRACMHWFTLPEGATPPTEVTHGHPSVTDQEIEVPTTMETSLGQHYGAALAPSDPRDRTIVRLTAELAVLGERYKDDAIMLDAVEKLAASIIALLEGGTDKLIPGIVDKAVRSIVTTAGGDGDGL